MENEEILKKISGKKILLVGNLILEDNIMGKAKRISYEAPVPLIDVKSKNARLGASGNIARSIKELGSTPYVLGVVGKDDASRKIISLFEEYGILSNYIISDHDRPTSKITRVSAGGQYISIIAEGLHNGLNQTAIDKLMKYYEQLIPEVDAVIVSDTGNIFLTEEMMYFFNKKAKEHNKPLFVRPHQDKKHYYMDSEIVVCTLEEAYQMAEIRTDHIEKVGEVLTEYLNSNVVIDRLEKGAIYFNKHGNVIEINQHIRNAVDVTGARSTFLGVLVLCLAGGVDIETALKVAKKSEEISFSKLGSVHITPAELRNSLARIGMR